MNEIFGSGAWSSHAGKVLQQLSFGNLISPNDMDHFISNDYFCVIGFFYFFLHKFVCVKW